MLINVVDIDKNVEVWIIGDLILNGLVDSRANYKGKIVPVQVD